MKGLASLFLGIFGTFAFSWVGLTVIPNLQIGHLDPQSDEEGTDIYPVPKSGMVERGRKVYAANGCIYCHSQQLRPDYISDDVDRDRDYDPRHPKWGQRRSAPRDYIFDRPVLLGKERMGPDLANIGKAAPAEEENAAASPPPPAPATTSPAASPASTSKVAAAPSSSVSPAPAGTASPAPAAVSPAASPASASKPAAASTPGVSPAPAGTASPAPGAVAAAAAPSPSPSGVMSVPGEPQPYTAAWHHRHLYSPRSISIDSNMPAYRFLYKKRQIGGERSADAVNLTGRDAPPSGWEIVPTFDAQCLVAYLMSLDQSHPLPEVKSAAPGGPAISPPAASPATGAASPASAPATPK